MKGDKEIVGTLRGFDDYVSKYKMFSDQTLNSL